MLKLARPRGAEALAQLIKQSNVSDAFERAGVDVLTIGTEASFVSIVARSVNGLHVPKNEERQNDLVTAFAALATKLNQAGNHFTIGSMELGGPGKVPFLAGHTLRPDLIIARSRADFVVD